MLNENRMPLGKRLMRILLYFVVIDTNVANIVGNVHGYLSFVFFQNHTTIKQYRL